jgi:polynucleotide 5'-hydroxyl-kinase GRC3/NOL9
LQQTLQANKTLLVDGPASVQVISGKAQVFSKSLMEAQQILVREGKRMPFYAVETVVFNVLLGANAAIQEVEGDTIPESWNKPVQILLNAKKKPVVIMVLGAADAGKSSFCTYLLNKLVTGGFKVAILDGDLGQSDIGPCASIGYAVTSKPVTELYNLKLQNGYFIGITSPVSAIKKTIEGLSAMLKEASGRQVDFVLINTDGFVNGEDAINYKINLIEELKPDIVIGVRVQAELDQLFSNLGGPGVFLLDPSPALSLRSPEKRKSLREMTYAKYLKKSKLQCYPLSQITVEPRNGVPKTQDPEKGVLVGLYGRGSRFLGIGVLRAINVGRRTLKVQTSVTSKPMRLVFGKVLLNEKLQEVQNHA